MIDSVRVAITALRTKRQPDGGDLSVIPVMEAPAALLGIDHLGRPHLLLEVQREDGRQAPVVGVAALAISERELVVGARVVRVLDTACLFESVAEVFEHFVAAVLDRLSEDGGQPADVLIAVLERWRLFLTPPSGPVSRAKLASVLCELLVLLDVVRRDPRRRVDAWVGPFGSRHDFRRGSEAFEVKSTRAHTGRHVTVHGEDQLDPPEGGTLHLHFVRLEDVPDGEHSVFSVVDALLTEGVRSEPLFTALDAAGIPAAELATTSDTTFSVRERLTVPIDSETPRIIPSSFVGGTRPSGVVELSYVIDLDHAIDRALGTRGYDGLIDRLALG